MLMRKFSKGIHTLASAGLAGGLACYMMLLMVNVPTDAVAFAQMRATIMVISYWVIFPSLIICIVSGIISMVVHEPFQDKGWVWVKAGLGFIMVKGVLLTLYQKAALGAQFAEEIVSGKATTDMLQNAISNEWSILVFFMVLTVANFYFGIWRPRQLVTQGSSKPAEVKFKPASETTQPAE